MSISEEPSDNLYLILNTITDGVVVVDHLGRVLYSNASAERIFERKNLVGKNLAIPVNTSITTPQEINLIRASGIGWAELRSAPIEWNDHQAYVIGIRDITENKLNDDRLRLAAAVFENTRDGVMAVDTNLSILYINAAFTEITGYTEQEAIGKHASLLRSGRHNAEFYAKMWHSINTTGHWQGEIWNRRKNNEIYPELLSISSVTDKSGILTHYVGVFADISKLRESELQLDFLAHHDPLTRLPNRLILMSRLEHAIKVAQRENKILAVLMLDLDRFKEVNDLFGHLVGDELLQQVAARLNARLRGIDTVCRLGGDEFVILLENITQTNDAAVVATDIVVSLREPYELAQDIKVSISASIGISLYPDHGNKPEQLLQHADSALYHAKSEGKNRFKYFSERFHDDSKNQTDIENRLRYGIEQSQLRLFYQPQINIKTGDIIGAEALLRWQDPINGLILPKSFIHLAEKTGLITTIGNWVLKEACMQGRHWLDTGLSSFTLSVNISLHQFRYGHLDQLISSILTETGFPANRLVIELTESALMLRETEALQILERLHALGVILAIDNFGMGYSSLSYLQRFPVQQLKIDKCFIARLAEQQRDSMITSTIIALAHALDFKVLAEGVETNAQLEFLQMHGCDLYQGYLASPPLPADEFTELLRNQLKMSDSH